jgi:hypothetical protein
MADGKRGARALPIAGTNTARVIGGAGVLACVLCCVSIPSVIATISALGLGFLRNDRLLLPVELISLVILVGTFLRARHRHGRNAPLLCGLVAAAWTFFSLMSPAPLGTVAALSGAVLLVAVVVWDWRLQRRCV